MKSIIFILFFAASLIGCNSKYEPVSNYSYFVQHSPDSSFINLIAVDSIYNSENDNILSLDLYAVETSFQGLSFFSVKKLNLKNPVIYSRVIGVHNNRTFYTSPAVVTNLR